MTAILRTSLDELLTTELDRLGDTKRWIWSLFLAVLIPNIFLGIHFSSYVFIGKMPTDYWCDIPALRKTGWTSEQIRNVSSMPRSEHGCRIRDLDYQTLALQSPSNHTLLVHASDSNSQKCTEQSDSAMRYNIEGNSIVTEWDLVCDRGFLRSSVQTVVSMGKGIGSIGTGFLADRFGRRLLYIGGALFFMISSILMTVAPSYWAFLAGRLMLGISSSMMFYPTAVLIAENVAPKHRGWTSLALHAAHPVGMIYLAISAWWLSTWRELQLALTVPTVLLLVNILESPRWLISKNRLDDAHKLVFGPMEVDPLTSVAKTPNNNIPAPANRLGFIGALRTIYGIPRFRRIALICHFMYITAALSFYVSVINCSNLSANSVLYVLAMAAIDSATYALNIVLLGNIGRRWNISVSFALAAIAYVALLGVAKDAANWQLILAMLARMGVCSSYGFASLYTAEQFPIQVRATAVGLCGTLGHLAAMAAPFVVDGLGSIAWFIPTTICAVALGVGSVVVFLTPETGNSRMLDDWSEGQEAEAKGVEITRL